MQQQQGPTARQVRNLGRTLVVLGTLVLALLGVVGGADAAVAPITDYAGYPAALPAGCPDGTGALTGLSFSNGRGSNAAALSGLAFEAGDTVTMSWSGFAAACLDGSDQPAITVSLATYSTPGTTFDPSVDQSLVAWNACGAEAGTCPESGGRYALRVTLPAFGICTLQLDAVLGRPLAVVGPSGSFYSSGARGSGPNRLLSAANFAFEPCDTTPTTIAPEEEGGNEQPVNVSTTTPPLVPPTSVTPTSVTPTTAPAEAPTTTTVAPAETTTTSGPAPGPVAVAPSLGLQPSAPVGSAPLAVGAGNESVAPAPAARQQAARLPFTGTDTLRTLRVVGLLTLAGGISLLVADLLRRRRSDTTA